MAERKRLGIAVVGSGRIGTIRTRQALEHPAVEFVAVSDAKAENAKKLAEASGAHHYSADNREIIEHPDVNTVIVSTSEGEHTEPVLQAIAAGKSVLVEKPIALNLADADSIIAASEKAGVEVRIGYSRRYKDLRYLLAKEQIVQGRLGRVIGASARVFNNRSNGLAILKRDPEATPIVDALTYYVDIMNWMLEGSAPVEVFARGQKGVLKDAGYDVDDLNWAIVTYGSGAVANFGVSFALPEKWPALGHSTRFEILGTEGVLIIDDDHTDQIMYTNKGVPHVYLPNHEVNMVFLNSGTPGDWALGQFWGAIANETRAWLDHLVTGKPCMLTTPREARTTLETTLAIQLAAESGRIVNLPLPM
jgi:myo-inositol 2-dehydrogenase / D-chiro-inositol 1-dehydrogenase